MTPEEKAISQYLLLLRSGFLPHRKCPFLVMIYEELSSDKSPSLGLLRLSIRELESLRMVSEFHVKTASSELPKVKKSLEDCQRAIRAVQTPVSDEKTNLRQEAKTLSLKEEDLKKQHRFHSQDHESLKTLIQLLWELLDKQLPQRQTAG